MTVSSLSDAERDLGDLVKAAQTHQRTTITKNGKPAAVLMSVEDLESLDATLELLSDPEALADIEDV
jgi:antitoxin YefM